MIWHGSSDHSMYGLPCCNQSTHALPTCHSVIPEDWAALILHHFGPSLEGLSHHRYGNHHI